jgi:hypothetical protein
LGPFFFLPGPFQGGHSFGEIIYLAALDVRPVALNLRPALEGRKEVDSNVTLGVIRIQQTAAIGSTIIVQYGCNKNTAGRFLVGCDRKYQIRRNYSRREEGQVAGSYRAPRSSHGSRLDVYG